MDEFLSKLDAKVRVRAPTMLGTLHLQLGTAFVRATHHQAEAMTVGTRIAVRSGAVLQQVDTPQNLYDRPPSMIVAGFIGSPSMNFFDAVTKAAMLSADGVAIIQQAAPT